MYPVFLFLLLATAVQASGPVAERPNQSVKANFQFIGKVLQSDGTTFRGVVPVIFLHGATAPFAASTLAGPDGGFKFKNLHLGMYLLTIAVPEAGTMRQTIEVGPSFADSKGRIKTTFRFDGNHSAGELKVTSKELSVPESARSEYHKALDRLGKGDIAGAITSLKKAVEVAPQFLQAWNRLGTIAYQSEDYKQAEKYFREALRQQPDAYPPLVNLGGALASQGKAQESLEVNLRAVRARPDDPLAHSQLGQSYLMLNQLQLAEKHLKQAKALDAKHFSFPQLVLAEIYRRTHNNEALIAELEEFLKFHPDCDLAPRLRKVLEDLRAGPK